MRIVSLVLPSICGGVRREGRRHVVVIIRKEQAPAVIKNGLRISIRTHGDIAPAACVLCWGIRYIGFYKAGDEL